MWLKVEFWKWLAVGERCRDGSVVGIRTPDGNILVHAVPYWLSSSVDYDDVNPANIVISVWGGINLITGWLELHCKGVTGNGKYLEYFRTLSCIEKLFIFGNEFIKLHAG